ncbi:MAG: hypothetical protein FJZ04_00115 [Candidatus Moranbacteria bacterium]|nr:hypothetical protein [Candidatus Moranbacteria bacterium]
MCGLSTLFSKETYLRGYLIQSGPGFFELLVWPDQPGILGKLFQKAQEIRTIRAARGERYAIVTDVAGYPNQLRKIMRVLNAGYLAARKAA